MNSSAKFFVPIVIAGFGPAAEEVELDVVCLLPPPPQAASPIRSATPKEIANAALAARRVCFRNISALLSGLPSPGCPWTDPTLSAPSDARQRAVRARARRR